MEMRVTTVVIPYGEAQDKKETFALSPPEIIDGNIFKPHCLTPNLA